MTDPLHNAEKGEPECECFWTDPSTWLSAASCGYGGGYEPGSQREWNPDCPVHLRVQPCFHEDCCLGTGHEGGHMSVMSLAAPEPFPDVEPRRPRRVTPPGGGTK